MGHHHERRAESRDVMATDMAALSLFNRGRKGGRDAATVIRHAKGDAGIRQVATWQGRGWPNRVLKELGSEVLSQSSRSKNASDTSYD